MSSLLKKSLIYAVGTFGSKVLIFLLVPLYSYFVNKEGFGYYDIVNSTMNLLIPLLTFQISDSLFRWLITKNDDFNYSQKIISNGFIALCGGILVVFLASLMIYFLNPIQYQGWITIMFVVAMIYPFLQQVTRGLGKNKLFALNGITYSFIYVLANVFFLIIFKLGVEGIFLSSIVAFFLASMAIVYRIKFHKYLRFSFYDKAEITDLIKYSLPLVPNTISWWLINSANKYIILFFLGVSANGLFAMSNRFPIIMVMINQIFMLAWQEQAIVDYEKKDAKTNASVLNGLIKAQFILVVVLSLVSQWVISLILSTEYYESWKYMPILFLGAAFNSFSAYYGAFYLGAKKTKIIFTTTVFGGIVSILLSLVLVNIIGLLGVAIAIAIGYFTLFIIRRISIKKITQIDSTSKSLYIYGGFVLLAFIVTYLQNQWLTIGFLLVFLSFVVYDNRDIIKQLSNKFKSLVLKRN